MSHGLDAAQTWFTRTEIDGRIARIEEPHVHEFLRANIWHVRGRDRDLVVDAGLGVASLREDRPELFSNSPILVVTHAHLDHMGSAHEFEDRRAHALEPVHDPAGTSIHGPLLGAQLGLVGDLPELLVTAYPAGATPEQYELRATTITQELAEGSVIDLGDIVFDVLHLPGHTPGSVCLFNRSAGILFSGDVIYDDVLLDELLGSDKSDYVASLQRLKQLPVRVVHAGHGESFDQKRLHTLIDEYVSRVAANDTPEHGPANEAAGSR